MKRHGREVEEIGCTSREEAVERILERVKLDAEGYETAAVLVMTEQEAHRYLQKRSMQSGVGIVEMAQMVLMMR